MEKELKDKVVVVTGAAEGIGYAIIDKYLGEGIKIAILLDINEVNGKKAIAKLTTKHGNEKVVFIKCDVTKDLEKVSREIFHTYKQVDVLVNNAGVVDESSLRKTMELNCICLMEWTMKFWEHMRKDKGGRGGTIVNVGSIYSFSVDPYMVFYKASKFAAMGFTRTLGHNENFRKFGVRVLIICPGFTSTTLSDKMLCWDEHVSEFSEFFKSQAFQTADEVGKSTVEVFKKGESRSAWKLVGGVLSEILLVAEGEYWR